VLVVGDRHYRLSGHEKELWKAAGDTVTVTGNLSGTELTVATVELASKRKQYAQE
jgi:hypothetical protein